jgi:hypothetical protein
LNIIMKKTRQKLEVPLNDGAAQTLEARQGAKHGPYVFYNPTTGDRFHDVKLGLKSAVKRAGFQASPAIPSGTRSPRGSRATGRVKELLGHSTVPVTHSAKRRALGKPSLPIK